MARAIARGKIRVDARRALSKLREHMLADPYSYLSELCRGGVASGATALRVVTDADDVILSWAGGTPPVGRVLRLFDYLLSDVASAEERRMRLLAIGVNAAATSDPAAIPLLDPVLPAIVAAIKGADPDITLQAICTRLEAMRERTPRGRASWQPSSVKMLLERAEKLGLLE